MLHLPARTRAIVSNSECMRRHRTFRLDVSMKEARIALGTAADVAVDLKDEIRLCKTTLAELQVSAKRVLLRKLAGIS